MAWISPFLTWNETSSSAFTPGNSFVMFRVSSKRSPMCAPRSSGPGADAGPSRGRLLLLPVHLPLLQIAALDQHVVEVVLRDDDGFEQHRRHVLLVVVDGLAAGLDGLAVREVVRHLDGLLRERARVLEDGHALRALDDADGARQLGVLTGDGDLAGETLRGEGLDAATGRAVVGGEHRVD